MTLQEMQKRKRQMGLSYEDLARLSGVPLSTVQKVMSGQTQTPRRTTLIALESVLAKPQDEDRARQPGEFTIEDYLKLPDDCRVELIDGVFYDMAAPTPMHQRIAARFFNIVQNYIDAHHGSCIPFCAPVDVQLDCDELTMVQPDFLIVCRPEIITKARIVGAPDFVMEVLSPSTKLKDMFLKAKKYANAGVREYWMIDPEKQQVLIHTFSDGIETALYGFDAEIPVAIYDGDLVIDMKRIRDEVAFLL